MKIAVLGIGGIGGVVGACLASKFDDIHFIARGKTLEAIKENGVRVESLILGKIEARPTSVTDNPDDIGVVDILIVCTKGYGLEKAIKQCEGIIGEKTVILPLLNGINISNDIRKYTDKGIAADGAIYVFANIMEPGVIRHSNNLLKVVVGLSSGERNEKLLTLVDMLNESGIESSYSDEILVPLWEKYIMMGGNSCIFSYYDGPAGIVQPYPERMEYAFNIFKELALLARLHGVTISDSLIDYYMERLKQMAPDAMTSLYRDLKNGSPETEFDAIIGKAYHLSQKLNAETPCIDAVYKKYRG
ncbi:MAG: 2-dehydropantoate 2-reductase [Firmicutes bacterium]|nr:2-dehydropantoate 2-reductase [Bacillota bacterium]